MKGRKTLRHPKPLVKIFISSSAYPDLKKKSVTLIVKPTVIGPSTQPCFFSRHAQFNHWYITGTFQQVYKILFQRAARLLTQAQPLGLNLTSLPGLQKCLQSGCLSMVVSESHIRPYCQLPAPQTSGLPLLGQNTAGQELWPLLHLVYQLLEWVSSQ